MYIAVSSLVLIISFFLFKKAAGTLALNRLNMISWVFYYNLIIQSFFAAVLVISNTDNHYLIAKLQNQDSRFYGWAAVMYTMIVLPLGMLFVNFLLKKSPNKEFERYTSSPIIPLLSNRDSFIRIPLLLLSFISICSVIYTMYCLPEIPMIKLLKGGSTMELMGLRVSASREFSGNQYVRNILAITLTPIITLIYFSYYKMTKLKKDKYIFFLMFFFAIIILTYNLAKGPFVAFILSFMFLKVLIDGEVKKKVLYAFGVSVFLLIIIAYIKISQTVDIISLLSHYNSGIIGRIILSQSAGTYLMFDIFPNNYDFIGFDSISSVISSAFNLDHSERAARMVMMHIYPNNLDHVGVMNSLFIAEAWANFGVIGVVLAPFYVGMVLQILYLTFLKLKKTPIILGLFAFLTYKSSITGGFNDYIYNAGYLIIFIIFIFLYFFGKSLKVINKTTK